MLKVTGGIFQTPPESETGNISTDELLKIKKRKIGGLDMVGHNNLYLINPQFF